jgi:hypothetical protein
MASIHPRVWGPSAWHLLHDVSFYIAGSDDAWPIAREFFMLLRHLLPCVRCQLSYDTHLLHLPFPSKKEELPRWVFDLHNRINDSNGVKERPVWSEWHIEYPRGMGGRGLRDIWPFVQSIAETYPSGSRIDVKMYQKSASRFLVLLWEMLSNMKGYKHDMELLGDLLHKNTVHSRRAFQSWITQIGRKMHYTQGDFTKCDETCKK